MVWLCRIGKEGTGVAHTACVWRCVHLLYAHKHLQEIAVISGYPSVLDPFMGHPPKSGALLPLGSCPYCVQLIVETDSV